MNIYSYCITSRVQLDGFLQINFVSSFSCSYLGILVSYVCPSFSLSCTFVVVGHIISSKGNRNFYLLWYVFSRLISTFGALFYRTAGYPYEYPPQGIFSHGLHGPRALPAPVTNGMRDVEAGRT